MFTGACCKYLKSCGHKIFTPLTGDFQHPDPALVIEKATTAHTDFLMARDLSANGLRWLRLLLFLGMMTGGVLLTIISSRFSYIILGKSCLQKAAYHAQHILARLLLFPLASFQVLWCYDIGDLLIMLGKS
ncbi:unnamed protein product [Prunus armeniaca]